MRIQIRPLDLLKLLQVVAGVIERRQTIPILGNLLLDVKAKSLAITATDHEIEITGSTNLTEPCQEGMITVSGYRLLDICRKLPDSQTVTIVGEENKAIISCGRSRFILPTLPATEFPRVSNGDYLANFTIASDKLYDLLKRVGFAMAQQDVRYYLNGMLIELTADTIKLVATDGHRLALSSTNLVTTMTSLYQAILPRKGVMELLHLLGFVDGNVDVYINANYLRLSSANFTFISKLIDGRYPNYEKAIPRYSDQTIIVAKDGFYQALTRVEVVTGDKHKGVKLQLASGLMKVMAIGPDQEEALEELDVEYAGDTLNIGFNIKYLLDVFAIMNDGFVKITYTGADSSALFTEVAGDNSSLFVIMPIYF